MKRTLRANPKEMALALSMHVPKPRNKKPNMTGLRPFKPGPDPRRNPGGKPKIYVKFSAMIMERLLEKCPLNIRKAFGLKPSATIYDALIYAQLHSAMCGDNTAFMSIHDLLEGKLANKNISISAGLEKLLADPEFQQFVEGRLAEYTQMKGELHGPANGAEDSAAGRTLQAHED